ncbi:carboxypeptidase-like regulatory domain-containing protein [Psychroserpens algicola]|uniref:Carboxypeptidase-like regulatory domain-containing protein n=1 Tax=Psychroserpens algicola TaxID=1719034 RepID=A0ABT0H9X6_9FLAO|nr:carboxypeptidase-like regulatory domain-containing protein [Psychroserpens algicola]MCK8481160.1 carboxypeptidase-like regulatory domain-containing protein [Psychroserpens algicola]
MRTSLHINIPKPCQEDWNQMTPQDKGRHCNSCQKTVFDFTNATDETIVKAFQSEPKLCGRFKSSQLNRELVLSRKEKRNYISFVASTLFAFLSFGTQELEAQGKPKVVKIDSIQSSIRGKVGISVLKKKVIVGTVVSDADGLPLPGASIRIKGTNKGVQTDFDGHYKIKVNVGDTLVFTYVGNITEAHVITNKSTVDIRMKEDFTQLECTFVGFPTAKDYRDCEKEKRNGHRKNIRNGHIERTNVGQFLYNITNIFRRKK